MNSSRANGAKLLVERPEELGGASRYEGIWDASLHAHKNPHTMGTATLYLNPTYKPYIYSLKNVRLYRRAAAVHTCYSTARRSRLLGKVQTTDVTGSVQKSMPVESLQLLEQLQQVLHLLACANVSRAIAPAQQVTQG